MRSSALLPIALLLALAACGSDPTDDVATVGAQSLEQDSLFGFMVRAGGGEVGGVGTHVFADAIAQGWLDLALVAEAAGSGLTPADVEGEALAPWVRTEHLRRLQNARAVARDPLTEEELRSAFESDSLRLYQRVLVRVSERWNDFEVHAKRARADSILALARAGASFDRLAMELSEGPDAPHGGYLGVVTRAETPAGFPDSLWALEPGGISPVLATDQGLQILRRPPFAEARDHLAAHLLRIAGARADSLLTDSLATAHGLSLLPTTARRLREVLTNPDSLAPDSAWIVRFEEGGVTPEEAWVWLGALPDGSRLSLARASEAELERAARSLARNEMLYRMARARGIEVAPDDLAAPREEFTTAADSLFGMFAGADAARRGELVDSIIDAVLSGRPPRLLPAGLAPALRRRIPHAFDREALARVTRRASWDVRADSFASEG